MPQYMSKRGRQFLFRRRIPEQFHKLFGKTEFKYSLGGDYKSACVQCRQYAVETDRKLEEARKGVKAKQKRSYRYFDSLSVIRNVTSELKSRLKATVIATTDSADIQRRSAQSLGEANSQESQDESHFISLEEARLAASEMKELSSQAFATGKVGQFRHAMHQTLHLSGHRLADELIDTQSERELLLEYVRAIRAASTLLEARYSGEDPLVTLPAEPLQKATGNDNASRVSSTSLIERVTSNQEEMLLSSAIAEFISHLPPTSPMAKKYKLVLPAFLELSGDMPIKNIKQMHVNEFLRTVQKLPPNWGLLRSKTGKSIRELAEQKWEKCVALKTYDDGYRASLRAFIKRAEQDWQDIGFPTTLKTNIAYTGSRTKAEFKQRALRPHEIKMILEGQEVLEAKQRSSMVHKFWLPVIALYTGARIREICQINPQSDWGAHGSEWWLRITAEEGMYADEDVRKSVKTAKARVIPMHRELIRLGLPDYLKEVKRIGARRMFPQWGTSQKNPGAAPGKWFSGYLKQIGLHGVANEIGNAIRGAHAFRHTLLTYGRMNGTCLRCISGHMQTSDNVVADEYEDETMLMTFDDKVEHLRRLDYGIYPSPPVLVQLTHNPTSGKRTAPTPRRAQ